MRSAFPYAFLMIFAAVAAQAQRPGGEPVVMHETNIVRDEVIMSEGGGAIPALPLETHTAGEISYVSGGVGEEELAMLKGMEEDFNLHVLLAGAGGAYVGRADLRVLNSEGGQVIVVEEAGPYVYLRLPPGRYGLEVTARQGGLRQGSVSVPAQGAAKTVFRFTE